MARAKKKEEANITDPWEYYQSIQLTPAQKAAARAEVERRLAEVAKTGVYEKILALIGKVHLEYDIDELREDREDFFEKPQQDRD